MRDSRMYWFNYKTDEYEYREAPETDADALALLPQIPAARGLFEIHRQQGMGILEAMTEVLTACVGKEQVAEIVSAI